MIFPYGILVNREASRFVDEAPGPVDVHYDHISRDIANQPDGIAYVIYDDAINDVPNWKRGVRTDQPAITADSLGALARKLELDPERLVATVDTYNRACRDGSFKPLEVDGLATKGLHPKKSNWARPLRKAPRSTIAIRSPVVRL